MATNDSGNATRNVSNGARNVTGLQAGSGTSAFNDQNGYAMATRGMKTLRGVFVQHRVRQWPQPKQASQRISQKTSLFHL